MSCLLAILLYCYATINDIWYRFNLSCSALVSHNHTFSYICIYITSSTGYRWRQLFKNKNEKYIYHTHTHIHMQGTQKSYQILVNRFCGIHMGTFLLEYDDILSYNSVFFIIFRFWLIRYSPNRIIKYPFIKYSAQFPSESFQINCPHFFHSTDLNTVLFEICLRWFLIGWTLVGFVFFLLTSVGVVTDYSVQFWPTILFITYDLFEYYISDTLCVRLNFFIKFVRYNVYPIQNFEIFLKTNFFVTMILHL